MTAARLVMLDTSALVRRYLANVDRPLVLGAMNDADHWVASALARTELQLALFHAAPSPHQRDALWDTARRDWDAFWEVPVDARCLSRAAEIGANFGLSTVDAIHLAAADRLPRPVHFMTFDRGQIPAAVELGLVVIGVDD